MSFATPAIIGIIQSIYLKKNTKGMAKALYIQCVLLLGFVILLSVLGPLLNVESSLDSDGIVRFILIGALLSLLLVRYLLIKGSKS